MADNTIQVTIQGKNNLGPAVAQAKSDISGLGNAAQTAKSPLAGLGSVFSSALSGAAILGTVSAIGKLTLELGGIGQQVQQQRDYFNVWSGSIATATANMDAMRRAVGMSMTDSEAMAGANKLLSMGLASNASELENLSRMAVMLGGSTRSASESIEEFSLLLANQSILRLDTFGISGAKVRARIEELQAADKNLSREQAFLNAVMEEGTRKVTALQAAGVDATTATQDLATAFRGLKEAVGQGLAGATSDLQQGLAGEITALANSINASSSDAQVKLGGLTATLVTLRQQLEAVNAAGGVKAFGGGYLVTTEQLTAQIAELEAKIGVLRRSMAEWGDAGVGAAQRTANSLPPVAAGVTDVNAALSGSADYWAAWAGFAENAALRASNAAWAARSAMGQRAAMPTTSGTFTEPTQSRWGLYADWGKNFAASGNDPVKDWLGRQAAANKAAAADWANAYNTEAQKVSGRISGYLSQGMQAATSLKDMRGDLFAPGANGPFENLFRALDVANLGGASPWAEKLGLTQEDAKRISEDFQRGIFSPEVMGLVDQGALIKEAQLAAMAEKTREAFATAIAKKAGVGTNLVSAMFGFSGGNTQGAAGAQEGKAAAQVEAAMTQVAGALGNTVQGKDFAGKIIGYGERIWGYFEQGIVDTAKKSSTLQAAIDGMVAAALAKRGGGGVAATARGQGVN